MVNRLNVGDALDVARKFIVIKLNGASGSINPLSALYDPGRSEWTLKFWFQKVGETAWRTVQMTIDDSNQEVRSFNVAA